MDQLDILLCGNCAALTREGKTPALLIGAQIVDVDPIGESTVSMQSAPDDDEFDTCGGCGGYTGKYDRFFPAVIVPAPEPERTPMPLPSLVDLLATEQKAVQVGFNADREPSRAMTGAEFRALRERLGLTGEWLAEMWAGEGRKVATIARSIRKWEQDKRPIPAAEVADMRRLDATFVAAVDALVVQWGERDIHGAANVLSIPDGDAGGFPGGWWRSIGRTVVARTGTRLDYI